MSLTERDIATKVWMLEIPEEKSKKVVDTLIEILTRTLASGEDILIRSFGKFLVNKNIENEGRSFTKLTKKEPVTFKCSKILRNKIEMVDRLISLGIKHNNALLLYDHAEGSKELNYFISTCDTLDIIEFGNKITPKNWVLHPRGPSPELKPGTLYVEIDIPEPEDCEELFETTGKFAWVELPMNFIKISDLADAGDKRAEIALKKFGDGCIAQISMNLCTDINTCPQYVLVHELAHVVGQRYLSQKLKAWRGNFIYSSSDKMEQHGLIYQWAYDLLIKRVEKIYGNELGKLVVKTCRKDLVVIQETWAFEIEDILNKWSEGTITSIDRQLISKIKSLHDKDLDLAVKSIEPYYEF